MLTRDSYKRFFRELGEQLLTTDELLPFAEEYVCAMYGLKKVRDVYTARFELFKRRLHSSGVIDLSVIPPCKSVLLLHLRRSALTAYLWKQSKNAIVTNPGIDKYGWFPDGEIEWTLDVYPVEIQDIFEETSPYIDSDTDECETESESESDESDEDN